MPRSNGSVADADFAGARVLVADDDTDALELLACLLGEFGLQVTTATSGDEAFDKFVETRPSVVVSDIQMPQGSGLDLVSRIRALSPDNGGLTPAIAMSGGANIEQSLNAGFHAHFVKPVSAPTLINAIRSFVR